MKKINKIINVNFMGGILGLFTSPRNVLQNKIQNANNEGWSVRQVQKGALNPAFVILSVMILFMTCFIYMPTSGYMVILEKES